MAALSTFYPEANAALQGEHIYQNPLIRNKQIFRLKINKYLKYIINI